MVRLGQAGVYGMDALGFGRERVTKEVAESIRAKYRFILF